MEKNIRKWQELTTQKCNYHLRNRGNKFRKGDENQILVL